MREIRIVCQECGQVWNPITTRSLICPNCASPNPKLFDNIYQVDELNNTFPYSPNYDSQVRQFPFPIQMPSEAERIKMYFKNFYQLFILSFIASIILFLRIPSLGSIGWGKFVILFLVSRIADIVSTLIALQFPWMIETNPIAEVKTLNGSFWIVQFQSILRLIFITFFFYLLFPKLGIFFLLTYTLMGFIVTFTNLFQSFFMIPSNLFMNLIATSIVSFGVYHLLKGSLI
ncbi:MAG: hypothetical protein NC827_06725 [Candidatus Omnitrophica bacterium]|nr:hypothetical protein [Candidatus Omnitrophota bacterium]